MKKMKRFNILLSLLLFLLVGCNSRISEVSFEYTYDTFYSNTESGIKAGNKEELLPKTTHDKICLSLVASSNVNDVVKIPSNIKNKYKSTPLHLALLE